MLASDDIAAQCRTFYKSEKYFDLDQQQWKFSHKVSVSEAINKYTAVQGWQDIHLKESLSSLDLGSFSGDGWYRCFLHVGDNKPTNKAIYLGRIRLVDKVYVNGILIGETSSFGRERYNFAKKRLYSIPNTIWQRGDNLIAINLAGNSVEASGILQSAIVDEQFMARKIVIEDIPKIILSLAYILLAIVIGLFYFSPNQRETLYIGLFALFLGLYYMLQTWVRYEIFSSFSTSYVIELMLLFCCPPLIFEYLYSISLNKRHKYSYGFYGFSAFLVILVVVLPNDPVTWNYLVKANAALIFLYLAFFASLNAGLWTKNIVRPEEKNFHYLKIGGIAVLVFFVWDSLGYLGLHSFVSLLCIGFFIFICTALLQILRDIVHLYNTMLASEKQTRLVEKRKTQSIYNMSQEFEKGLQGLYVFVKDCNRNPLAIPKLFKKCKRALQRSITSLENLIRDNEIIRALESGSYIPKLNTLRVNELCKTTIDRALAATEKSAKRVKVKIDQGERMIMLDSHLLSLAFYHLVENALLYTEGKVECNIEFVGQELKLQVIDEGPGLDMKKASRLFQKFSRLVEADSEISGLGVGLALVSLAAKNLGGRVVFSANHGFFSDFSLFVPAR